MPLVPLVPGGPLPGLPRPPWQLSGRVYGALLNHAPERVALGDAAHQPPYKAPPRAPVLQVKPRNTLAGDGAQVPVPPDVPALEVGASLAIVIGRTACRVAEADAASVIAGLTIAADLRVPHASHYRPAVRQRARDGFCPLGPRVVALADVGGLAAADALAVQVAIDGQPAFSGSTGERVRGIARLIADVTEFMTLEAGDVLMLGVAARAPQARVGQAVAVAIAGIGTLQLSLVAEAAAAERIA
ncbi:fumarylacetoacetate hydrolase family protein [Aquabacterium sp. OR-4]|uniref:fumarylacetoacetate hydrolase family protein n=1 Tax=Aquabacterium sp. OR-4 TaxID=2978127 RepID=UPI0021B446FC|nr:fumarylacetoacetate hydrolase family protein [Aquabacterium sp. OR-4]MDT7838396.1 fumarylacetoacetate hydrolase family protein [Aquabacterium sp. OR-4]